MASILRMSICLHIKEVTVPWAAFVNYHNHRAQLLALLGPSHARPSQRKANAWKVTPFWDVLCVTLHMLYDLICSFDL